MNNRRLYYGNGVRYNAPDGAQIYIVPYGSAQPKPPNILSVHELEAMKHSYKIYHGFTRKLIDSFV